MFSMRRVHWKNHRIYIYTHRLINQISTSATNEKLGCLKFSMEISLG